MEVMVQITGTILVLASLSYARLIFLFNTGWNRLLKRSIPVIFGEIPKVSVVIAARNEEENVVTLLEDLLRQDYPEALTEVILVDDHSTDRTAELAENWINQHDLPGFRIIRMPGMGMEGSKKKALGEAINGSSGEIILTTDADCRLPGRWISTMAGYFGQDRINLVAGPVAYNWQNKMVQRFGALEFLGLVASGAGGVGAGQPFICNGANLAFRKKAFLQADGYAGNEQYRSGDDVFLMHKMKKTFGSSTITFALNRETMVRTSPQAGLSAFFRQRARWASKSAGYRDFTALLTAVTVFILSLAMTAIFISGFIYPAAFLIFIGLVICKSLVDFPLMNQVTKFTGDKSLLKWLWPFQLFYPFYIVIAGGMSLFSRNRW